MRGLLHGWSYEGQRVKDSVRDAVCLFKRCVCQLGRSGELQANEPPCSCTAAKIWNQRFLMELENILGQSVATHPLLGADADGCVVC